MNMQNCQLEDLGGCSIITLMPQVNDLEWSQSEAMGNTLVSTLESKTSPSVMVDLTKLEYIGSAMVALIVRIWKTVENKGGKMVVANQHEMVYEVLNLAGLTKVWTIADSREEGMKLLGSRAAGSSSSGGRMGLVVLGVVFVIGALSGLGILLSGSEILSDKIAMIITFVFAALGMITGTLIFAQSTGGKKWMGAGVVLASTAVAVVGVIKFPVTQIMAPPQNNSETKDKEENKEKTSTKEKVENKDKTKSDTEDKKEKTKTEPEANK